MTPRPPDTPAFTFPAIIVLVACVILLGVTIIDVAYILPVFTARIASVGGSYGPAGRIALAMGRIGPFLLTGWVGGLIALLYRTRKGAEQRSQFRAAIALTAMVLATCLALLTGAFVDAAVWTGGP